MKLAVALMVLSTLPSRTAGQTTKPDQTPSRRFPNKRSASGTGTLHNSAAVNSR